MTGAGARGGASGVYSSGSGGTDGSLQDHVRTVWS